MTNIAKEFPDFFTVFHADKHSERMLIPDAFVSLMLSKQKVMKNFILRDHRGKDWHVKARPIGGKLYFNDGWKRFREENCLEENGYIVFTHIENNVFKFKILEQSSMCEKIKVMDEEEENNMMQDVEVVVLDDDDYNEDDDGNVKVMDEEEINNNVMNDQEEEEEEDEDDDDDDDDDNDDDDDDYTMVEEEDDDDDDDDDEEDDDDDDDDFTMVEEEDDDDEDEEEEEDDDDVRIIIKEKKNAGVGKGISRSCEHQHCRTCKARRTGSNSAAPKFEDEIDVEMYIQPGNPQFFAKYSPWRPNELHIPTKVIEDFSLCFPKHITLVCCNCKDVQRNEIAAYHHILPLMSTKHIQKRGKISTWRDGRVTVKGWEGFRKKSMIRENDSCLCEIMLRKDGTIEMLRVHVIGKNCAA
ncbi:hypothetical protein TSUD_18400 [Trifolium subterraneum]|uniref:TF-B3 domain-containing protein n=1 Tax=Trifolium subterraneum TaxID=3900 RepID=A0A2Z6N308_TRISU|nr:hypothetical protein TSUD_18400 [Trifolium subterraneum]